MTITDQLVTAIRMLPSQLAGDLLIGLPVLLAVVLILLTAGARRGGRR